MINGSIEYKDKTKLFHNSKMALIDRRKNFRAAPKNFERFYLRLTAHHKFMII